MSILKHKAGMTCGAVVIAGLVGLPMVGLDATPAQAVVYCQYVDYPQGCIVRPGVVLRPRPVARGAVRAGTASPTNMNGGVNRAGVRR